MKILMALFFFFVFWKGMNDNRTGVMYLGLIMTVLLLMWKVFEVWTVFAGISLEDMFLLLNICSFGNQTAAWGALL